MTTMTAKSQTWTASTVARIQALETNPVVEEVLAWLALAGFSALGFLVFVLAVGI